MVSERGVFLYMDMKPRVKILNDEHEEKASCFFDSFKNQKSPKDPELLRKAAAEFKQSSNPESKEIAQFLEALYLREKGLQEKDHKKAANFLIKSYSAFLKDKRTFKEAQHVLLQFYQRKIEINHVEGKNSTEIFLKRANVYKALGREDGYHAEMSLYCLYQSTDSIQNLQSAVKKLEEAVKHAKLSKKEEIIHKMEGILHKIKSYNSTNLEDAIREIEKEIESIDKTSDKLGKEVALGDLSFLKSKFEKASDKRATLIEEAASYYEKAGMQPRAHQMLGDAYQLRGNSSSLLEEHHDDYYQKASEEYGKAGNIRMQKWLEGHHHIALATKEGVIADNNEAFRNHLMAANHAYRDAGNIGGVQFTAGIGIFLEAIRAEYPKSLELFKAAAECLDNVSEKFLAAFARSEVARILASKSDSEKERDQHMLEEKNYLERAIIEVEKKDRKQTTSLPAALDKISPEILTHLSKARLEELNGFLEKNRELEKAHFNRAKQEYLAIQNSTAYQTLILSGLGWANLFLEDISAAKKYFDSLENIDPDNPHVKSGKEALDKLLQVKYSPEAESYLIKKRLAMPLIVSLSNDVSLVKNDVPYPSEFFNICLAIIKRSCNQMERYKPNFFSSDEPSLRNEVLIIANSVAEVGLGATLTGETFTGKGKSDIFAKDSQEQNDYFIGESKIWKSPSEYKQGFKQLTDRYLTASNRAGVLVNFVKTGKMSEVVEKAIAAIKGMDRDAKIHHVDSTTFVSEHTEYGIIFHHLVDLIPNRNIA